MGRGSTDGPGARGTAIVYVVGARPNFMKMAPVLAEMRHRAPQLDHLLVHTGQHYDREMNDVFLEELSVPAPDFMLGVGSGSHAVQTARVLERFEAVLEDVKPAAVVVPGDVNSTLAAALAAAKLHVPVAHLEAGLRSFDRSMPEEVNRVLVDQIATWCLIHSREAIGNLRREGIADEAIHFVGNTMIDTLVRLAPRAEQRGTLERLGLSHKRYLLVTLHRPALVDGPGLAEVISRLDEIAKSFDVVFPIHPRTRARLVEIGAMPRFLKLLDPVGYLDFLALEIHAAGVLTDSGGVQEETTFLGVPCFTLRDSTERPATVAAGTNRLLGLDPASIDRVPELLAEPTQSKGPLEYWDGRAAARVADVLLADLAPPYNDASGAAHLVAAS